MSEKNPQISAARLKQLRQACSLTQAEVAARIGVDKTTIMRWENGKGLSRLNISVLSALADIFGVAPAYLLGCLEQPLTREEEKLSQALDEARKLYQLVFAHTAARPQPASAAISGKIVEQVREINRIFLSLPQAGGQIGAEEAGLGLQYLLAYYGLPGPEYDPALLHKLLESGLLRDFLTHTMGLLRPEL